MKVKYVLFASLGIDKGNDNLLEAVLFNLSLMRLNFLHPFEPTGFKSWEAPHWHIVCIFLISREVPARKGGGIYLGSPL